jgi:hypothetical protein
MQQTIGTGGVKKVSTHVEPGDFCHMISVFVHHELPPERIAELVGLIERAAVGIVKTWAAP